MAILLESKQVCYEVAASVRAWKKTNPNLNKSTMRGFEKCYEAKLKEASHKNVSPKKKLANKMRGRPTLPKTRHKSCAKVPNSYYIQRWSREHAKATAKALVKQYPLLEKENLAPWAKSLFRCMGFALR